MKRSLLIVLLLSICFDASSRHYPRTKVAPTKNLIVMIVDGASTGLLSASRWMRHYADSSSGRLNIDPYLCGMVRSYSSDAPIPCSAPAMSAYMTGMPQQQGNISVYPKPNPKQDLVMVDPQRAYQPLATLLETAKIEQGKATGLVATVDFCHATPAACAAHAVSRGSVHDIIHQMISQRLDFVVGGGSSLITDEMRTELKDKNIKLVDRDLGAFRRIRQGKVWALMSKRNMSYEIDRDTTREPSLGEMTHKAIEVLSQNKSGFFLMVEGSKVDMAAHANDPIGTITEFLEFDRAVGVALDFARKDKNTTIVILPDHGTAGITVGDAKYRNYASKGLDSVYCDMVNYKHSALYMEKLLKKTPKEKVREVFRNSTGIELTADEEALLLQSMSRSESNYMEVANTKNLLSAISKIMTRHAHIGFASGNHTGEDVFLAVYHPKNTRPYGVNTNSEINAYMADVLGVKPTLMELTDRWFVKHTDLFRDMKVEVDKSDERPILRVENDGNVLLAQAFSSQVSINGSSVELDSPVVYIKETGLFYLPAHLARMLTGGRK